MDVSDYWGTAVVVQAMVFGNLGDQLGQRGALHRPSLPQGAAGGALG